MVLISFILCKILLHLQRNRFISEEWHTNIPFCQHTQLHQTGGSVIWGIRHGSWSCPWADENMFTVTFIRNIEYYLSQEARRWEKSRRRRTTRSRPVIVNLNAREKWYDLKFLFGGPLSKNKRKPSSLSLRPSDVYLKNSLVLYTFSTLNRIHFSPCVSRGWDVFSSEEDARGEQTPVEGSKEYIIQNNFIITPSNL